MTFRKFHVAKLINRYSVVAFLIVVIPCFAYFAYQNRTEIVIGLFKLRYMNNVKQIFEKSQQELGDPITAMGGTEEEWNQCNYSGKSGLYCTMNSRSESWINADDQTAIEKHHEWLKQTINNFKGTSWQFNPNGGPFTPLSGQSQQTELTPNDIPSMKDKPYGYSVAYKKQDGNIECSFTAAWWQTGPIGSKSMFVSSGMSCTIQKAPTNGTL